MYLDTLLTLSIALPCLIGLLLIILKLTLAKKFSLVWIKGLSFLGFFLPFCIAIYLFLHYPDSDGYFSYSFYSSINTGLEFIGIQLSLGLNGISLPMFLLTAIVGFSAGLYLLQSQANDLALYSGLILVMLGGLFGAFASVDLFYMYVFHELALIPSFIMMGLWGAEGRRSAAIEMLVYLSLGALLSLLGIIALYVFADCPSFNLINLRLHLEALPLHSSLQGFVGGLLLLGLGILVSLFPLHTWAPRAYAALPTAAVMLHAGILKKFGLYVILQVVIFLLPLSLKIWSPYILYLALGNIIFIGFVTIAQKHFKLMLSYSSVMHMGYCFLGIASLAIPEVSMLAIGGTLLVMFGHGLSSSLLFLLSNMVYKRTQTYEMLKIGGLCQKAPVLSAFFIAGTFASIGLPGFVGFWGEFSIFLALWKSGPYIAALALLGIIISAVYGLRAVASIFLGCPSTYMVERFHEVQDINVIDRLSASILLLTLLYFGFFPKFLTEPLLQSIKFLNFYVQGALPY